MTPVPKTRVEEIIGELEPHLLLSVPIDTFTLRRYQREVERHLNHFPWAGYVALAMIGVISWDEQAIDVNYRKALGIRNDGETHGLYANALQLIGKFGEASDEGVIASDLEPQNLTALANAIQYAQNAGRVRLAMELNTRYEQRSPDKPYSQAVTVIETAELLDAKRIREETIQQCNEVAFTILRKHKVPFVRCSTVCDGEDRSVMLFIEIDASDEVVRSLDMELGDALFDQVPDFDPSVYWVGFEKSGEHSMGAL